MEPIDSLTADLELLDSSARNRVLERWREVLDAELLNLDKAAMLDKIRELRAQGASAAKSGETGKRTRAAKTGAPAAAQRRKRRDLSALSGPTKGHDAFRKAWAEDDREPDEAARALGVSVQSTSKWREGANAPGPDNRARIEKVYGIKPELWDQETR